MSKHSAAALAALSMTVAGCAGAAAQPVPEGPRWTAADSAALDASVEALEERLLAHQARVRFWGELRERHEAVSAVACSNLGEHATAMARAEERQQARLAERKRGRVAANYDLRRRAPAFAE